MKQSPCRLFSPIQRLFVPFSDFACENMTVNPEEFLNINIDPGAIIVVDFFFPLRLHMRNYCHPPASWRCENLATGEGFKGKHDTRYKPYGCLCMTFKSTHACECIIANVSDGFAACLSRIHTIIIMLIVIVGP